MDGFLNRNSASKPQFTGIGFAQAQNPVNIKHI